MLIALEVGEVETLTPIKLRYTGKVIDLTTRSTTRTSCTPSRSSSSKQYMDTTVGRVILNDHLPEDMPFINGLLKKKGLGAAGQLLLPELRPAKSRCKMLDEIKDARLPVRDPRRHLDRHRRHGRPGSKKAGLVRDAEKEVVEVQKQYQDGAITHGERYNKIIEIWSKVTEKVSDEMFKTMKRTTGPAATSTRFTSWPTPALAVRNSRSASFPVCAD